MGEKGKAETFTSGGRLKQNSLSQDYPKRWQLVSFFNAFATTSPHLVAKHRAELPLGEDRGWKTGGSVEMVKTAGWWAEALKWSFGSFSEGGDYCCFAPSKARGGWGSFSYLVTLEHAINSAKNSGVEVWGSGSCSLCYYSNYSYLVCFQILSAIKIVHIFMLSFFLFLLCFLLSWFCVLLYAFLSLPI